MKKKYAWIIQILIVCLAILTAVGLFYFVKSKFIINQNELVLVWILALIFVLLGGVIHSFFHEAGHLIVGLMNNMKFVSLSVGFFQIEKINNKLRIKFKKSDYAGACQLVPKDSTRIYEHYKFYASGGLIGSFFHILICIISMFLYRQLGFYASIIILSTMPMGIALFITNLIPAGNINGRTDGQIIKGLIHKNPSEMLTVNLLTIQGLMFSGKMPRELDEKLLFEVCEPQEDDMNFIILSNYRYLYYLSRGESEKAVLECKKLKNITHLLPEIYRENILCDFLYNATVLEKNEVEAEVLFDEVKAFLSLEDSCTNLRIRGAYALYITENFLEARMLFNRGIDEADTYMIKGVGLMEKELMIGLKNDLDERQKVEEKLIQDKIKTRIIK